jgi:hypothetical protein
MIRKASTAALRYSSELFSRRQAHSAPPGWRSETVRNGKSQMICRFVLWGTLIL